MGVDRLTATGFRNLDPFDWRPGAGATLLLGGNGAGKTSVLECLHLAATTRSFRTAQLGDCLRREGAEEGGEGSATGRDAFDVVAEVSERADGGSRGVLALRWSSSEGLERRLDAKSVALAAYLEVLPVVAWTARDDEILAGLPERRRRLLDQGVVAAKPARLAELGRFRRTLGQKRELLRRRQAGLEDWNQLLAPQAAEIIRLRSAFVERLQLRLDAVLAASGIGLPRIELSYEPSPADGREGTAAVAEALSGRRHDEIRLQRPLVGPHLDRLQILWRGIDVSRVASAGERKAIGLLLLAARAELLEEAGRRPVVLADDLDTELDHGALAAIWRVLPNGRQLLASTNREEIAERLDGVSTLAVRNGVLAPDQSS